MHASDPGRKESASGVHRDVLAAISESLDEGRQPDPAALEARFPDAADVVRRYCAAAARYRTIVARRPDDPWGATFLPAGTRLGDFTIEAPLSSGGMGLVYRARQRSLGDRVVALKVMLGDPDDEATAARFLREARAASQVHHPHLVEVHGFGEAEGRLYYAMQLVDGPNLATVLDSLGQAPQVLRRPDVRRTLVERVAEVASALTEVHAAGLIHRDVKPANIVLAGEREADAVVPGRSAVLVDFGLVRRLDARKATETHGRFLSEAYASPEQMIGAGVDQRTDVFSLGVTLHDLISDRQPSERGRASAGLEPLDRLHSDVDADLAAVVGKAADPVARFRYASADAFHADLVAWLDGRPVAARPTGPLETLWSWTRRHPGRALKRGALGVAAVLIVLIMASGIARIADVLELASLARDQASDGNLRGLGPSLAALDTSMAGWLFAGSDLRALGAAMLDGGDDVLSRVRAAYQQRAEDEALLATAVALGLDGHRHVHADLLRDHLLWASSRDPLEMATGRAGPTGSSTRATAQRLLHRILDEGDLESAPALAWAAPIRERMRELLWGRDPPVGTPAVASVSVGGGADAPAPPGDEQLTALAALGACGTAADISPLRAWAAGQAPRSEARRLADMSLERILRRGIALAAARDVPSEQLDALEAHALEEIGRWRGWKSEDLEARVRLLMAVGMTRIARGEQAFPDGVVDLREGVVDPGAPDVSKLQAWLHELGSADDVDGWLLWSREQYARDPDTRLEAALGDGWRSGRSVRSDELSDESRRQDPDAYAGWDFQCETARTRGEATGYATRGMRDVAFGGDGTSLTVLRAAGRAELALSFTIPADDVRPSQGGLSVWVRHSRESRPHVPGRGRALIEVGLDGVPVPLRLEATGTGGTVDRFPIRREDLWPGEHRLTIRLAPDSTTSWKLLWIELRATDNVGGPEAHVPAGPAAIR